MIASSFNRPSFDPAGRIVARRELLLGKRYEPGQQLPPDALTAHQVATFWAQGLIDTLPREQPQQGKQQQPQRR